MNPKHDKLNGLPGVAWTALLGVMVYRLLTPDKISAAVSGAFVSFLISFSSSAIFLFLQ